MFDLAVSRADLEDLLGIAIVLGIVGALFVVLLHGALMVVRRRRQVWSQLISGVAYALFSSPENRFPNARMIEIVICQDCGYAGPVGQACPRCGQR